MEECIICFEETDKFTKFNCDHKVCTVCFPKLTQCPLCRDFVITIQTPNQRERSNRPEFCQLVFSMLVILLFCLWCFYIVKTG
jgi:hypothetical protein